MEREKNGGRSEVKEDDEMKMSEEEFFCHCTLAIVPYEDLCNAMQCNLTINIQPVNTHADANVFFLLPSFPFSIANCNWKFNGVNAQYEKGFIMLSCDER